MGLIWDAGKNPMPDLPEWKIKILNLPMEKKPFKAYVVYGDNTRQEKVGEFFKEEDAIRAAELRVLELNE